MSLADALSQSTKKSPYFAKDLAKARRATQMIGQGSPASSTAAYVAAAGPLANTGSYGAGDVVFVSAEGMRGGRFSPVVGGAPQGAYRNLLAAMRAGARFVMDDPPNRARSYNLGERQVADFLLASGYAEVAPGMFAKAPGDGQPSGVSHG